jgi:O-antigen/teichoic acid export membrane protein
MARWFVVRRMAVSPVRVSAPIGPAAREALRFGMHSTSVGLGSFVANQTDKALLSASFPVAAVGLYGFASHVAALFYNAVIVPQTGVFLSSFSRLRDDLPAARRLLAVSTRLLFSLALPVSALWVLEPRRLLEAFFGPRWIPAAPLVQIFALDYLMRAVFSGITGVQISFGLAAAAARTKWINALVFVALLLAAAASGVGLIGYALAYVTGSLVASLHNAAVNGKLLAIDWSAYARNLWPPLAIGMASTLAWALARGLVGHWPLWPALVTLSGTWLVTYCALSLGFNRMVWATLATAMGRAPAAA